MPVGTEPIDGGLLLWADCEFTGLPIEEGHKIIEIGALVTTLSLEEVECYSSFVKYDWSSVQNLMAQNPWWAGRTDDIERMRQGVPQAKPPAEVDEDLADLANAFFGDTRPPLCGNSIHSDKKHIDNEFPKFAAKLDYRIIDVTSLRLLALAYRNVSYEGKQHRHYALDDIRESVDELRFLLTSLDIADLPLRTVDK